MILKSFGTKLKETRENYGMSQLQLSKSTGVVREQISRIENGQINLTLETLHKLSVALNTPLKELLDIPLEEQVNIKTYNLRPFVKWAGGKTQLLETIRDLMPVKFATYYEPFLGGGALFLNVAPNKAVVADFNSELVSAFLSFKNAKDFALMTEELIRHEKNHSEKYYYAVRDMDRGADYDSLLEPLKAARLIYLNKACFNGLYRVNSKGYFNVPSGKKDKVHLYQKELFAELFSYLSSPNITILNQDFEKVVATAKKGDFVYFDPPYDTFAEKNNFTTYTKDSFGKEEQRRLAKVYKELAAKGVYVMLSNHNTKFIQELYKNFNIKVVTARRNINSKGTGRGVVEEVIIRNYE